MFLSKIWFFLITVVAALAITVALVMPRPAERAGVRQENKSVRTACLVTDILLRDNARARIQLTGEFAQAVRELKLSTTLFEASKGQIISKETNATGRAELGKLLESVTGTKPSFIWLLDRRGRVVARSSQEDKTYGDSMRGYYLVQDALDGYVRDDLWMLQDGLYRVAAAPVLTRDLQWAGAIVLGQAVDKEFAGALADNIDANINFYVAGDSVASSQPVQIHKDVVEGSKELAEIEQGKDCATSKVLRVKAGEGRYLAINARLPGEAGQQGAFFSVYVEQAEALDFMGTLKAAKKDDLGFDRFPWIKVALAFVLMMGIGFGLMFKEVDGPLKRLNKEAVGLAQGDQERFQEEAHSSKYGSIARSVNISIDKMQRATKDAKGDMDKLLGAAPSAGTSKSTGSKLPPVGIGASLGANAAKAPSPSDFKFGGAPAPAASDLGLSAPPPAMPGLTAPPAKESKPKASSGFGDKTPPPMPGAKKASKPEGGIKFNMKRPTDSQTAPAAVSLGGASDKLGMDADILGDDSSSLENLIAGGDPLGTELPPSVGAEEDKASSAADKKPEVSSPEVDPDEAPTIANDSAGSSGYFEQIFQEFMTMKKKCGESTENLTFERFSKKLQKNQDALIAKRSCSSVKFQVYEKDGKAALKASPVK